MLLAAAVLFSLAGAGVAGAARTKLKPAPPVSLPAHQRSGHQRSHPAHQRHAAGPSGLPHTGIDAQEEVAVALLLFGFGAIARGALEARPAHRDHRG